MGTVNNKVENLEKQHFPLFVWDNADFLLSLQIFLGLFSLISSWNNSTVRCETGFMQETLCVHSKEHESNILNWINWKYRFKSEVLTMTFLLLVNHPSAYCYHSRWIQMLNLEAQYTLHRGRQLLQKRAKVRKNKNTSQFPFEFRYISAFSYQLCQNVLAFNKL